MSAEKLFGPWAPRRLETSSIGDPVLPSNPDDPHAWSGEVTWEPGGLLGGPGVLTARFACAACGSSYALSLARSCPPGSDDSESLSRAIGARIRRAKIHPRCSELRTVKEVMDS